jgi:hypothetical protein
MRRLDLPEVKYSLSADKLGSNQILAG